MNRPPLNVWRVTAGSYIAHFFTDYHAEQMASALRRHPPLAGQPVTVTLHKMPDDPLTRLTVRP